MKTTSFQGLIIYLFVVDVVFFFKKFSSGKMCLNCGEFYNNLNVFFFFFHDGVHFSTAEYGSYYIPDVK